MNPANRFRRGTSTRGFRDRRDAGRVAGRGTHGPTRQTVCSSSACPRRRARRLGSRPALGAPLDVFLVRKLGVPQWTELAMGAVASGGGW